MERKHRPFTLLLRLGTPIVVPRHAIHLDALLWYCIGAHFDSSDHDELHLQLKRVLSFDETHGIYKASSMIMVVTPDQGVSAVSVTRADALTVSKLSTSDGFFSQRKRLVVNGGPTKKRLNNRDAYAMPFAAFKAVGNPDRCAALLRDYLPGIGVDARTARYGEIRDIDIILHGDENCWISFENGQPARWLPVALARDHGIDRNASKAGICPPYKTAQLHPVIGPDRITIQTIYSLTGA